MIGTKPVIRKILLEFLSLALQRPTHKRESEADPPWLFDTRVCGGWLTGEWERSSTLREALVSHEAWVARIRKLESGNKPPPPDALW